MATPTFALRSVTRFQCIQDKCEDSCCEGMHVLLADDEHDMLLNHSLPQPDIHAQLIENIKVLDNPLYGYRLELAKNEEGQCALMQAGRCRIHAHLGENALPHTCARFPRETTQREARLEITGALACPEMTRLTLFDDDSLDWVEVAPNPLLHQPGQRWKEHTQAQAFRELGMRILREPDVSLSQKLQRLLEEASMTRPATLPSTQEALEVVLAVLMGLRARDNRRYNAFNESVLFTWQMLALESFPERGAVSGAALAAHLGSLYPRRREQLQSALGEYVTLWLTRYAQHRFLQLRWKEGQPIQTPLFDFSLQLLVVYFLFLGNPIIQELMSCLPLDDTHLSFLKRAVVQTVQWFSKYIERDHDLWEEVRTHLRSTQGVDFPAGFTHRFAQCV